MQHHLISTSSRMSAGVRPMRFFFLSCFLLFLAITLNACAMRRSVSAPRQGQGCLVRLPFPLHKTTFHPKVEEGGASARGGQGGAAKEGWCNVDVVPC